MKKLVLLLTLLIMSFLLFNCKDLIIEKPEVEPEMEKVQLNFSQSELKSKGIVTSNQMISGNVNYYFCFWLTPTPNAKAIWEITSMDRSIIYYSSSVVENGISWLAPAVGMYLMEVSGTYGGSFSFVNDTINVTDDYVPPITSNTHPVRFYNPRIVNSNVVVDAVVTKGIYAVSPYSDYDWFYVKRINGLNFIGNQLVVNENDSVRFTLTFPATNGIYIEFMTGMHDGSTNGLWLTPSSYAGCLLYSGSENLPYENSGYFFGFRLVITGNNYEFKSYSGTTIFYFSETETEVIPGEAGDLISNNYQVRWTGFTHYFKTNLNAPVLRYKIGNTGSWTYMSLTQFSENQNYWFLTFPNLSGELFFQWGTGTDANFIPSNSEMINSMYYVSNLGMLAKNI